MNLLKFLCNFPIDKFGKVCYNGNFDAWRTSTRRQIKRASISTRSTLLSTPQSTRSDYSLAVLLVDDLARPQSLKRILSFIYFWWTSHFPHFLSFDILIIVYYAMFVNIFFTSFLFLLLASRFVKRKSPCLLNVRYFLLLVFIITTSFPLSCIYYIILLRICQ